MFFYDYEKYIMHGRQITQQSSAPAEQPPHTKLLKHVNTDSNHQWAVLVVSHITTHEQ